MSDFKAKMHQIRFRYRPEAYSAPRPLAGLDWSLLVRAEGRGSGKGREG